MNSINRIFLLTLISFISLSFSCKQELKNDASHNSLGTSVMKSATTPVHRKGVTLAGDVNDYIVNNFALLQQVLDAGVGVIGVNLPWYAATQPCPTCDAERPSNPTNWNDATYSSSEVVKQLDKIANYVMIHGNGAFVMGIAWGTPGWAACPGDNTGGHDIRLYPPQNASDFGDFMYAMSERYSGSHTNSDGLAIGKVRDWVIYNEVNTPDWWHNSVCNTSNLDPVYYYGGIMNAAYTAIHHLPSSLDVRALAGGFTSCHYADNMGNAGQRIAASYSDWNTQTQVLHSGGQNHAWISSLDFIQAMKNYNIQFDAIALHPYAVKVYDNPLLTPPSGAVTLANLSSILNLLQSLYPNDQSKWHLCLTEYHQQSYYGDLQGWDKQTTIPCPNYFCSETTENNLNQFLQWAYGTGGSNLPYVDYLIWTMWKDVEPYTGGLVRGSGTDKTEGLNGGSIRATYTAIQ